MNNLTPSKSALQKLEIRAQFHTKIDEYTPTAAIVENVLELPEVEFDYFGHNLNLLHTEVNTARSRLWAEGTDASCLMVLRQGGPEGILVDSLGSKYLHDTAFVPNARETLEQYASRLADDIVQTTLEEGIRGNIHLTSENMEQTYGKLATCEWMHREVKKALSTHPDIGQVVDDQWNSLNINIRPSGPTLQQLVNIGISEFYIGVHGPHDEFTPARIPELRQTTFTPAGKQEWADVLAAQVASVEYFSLTGCDLREQFNLEGISEQRAMDFGNLLAGNCTQTQQEKWVHEPARPATGYIWPHSQYSLKDLVANGIDENTYLVHESADVGFIYAPPLNHLSAEGQKQFSELLNASVVELRPEGAYGKEIVLGNVAPEALRDFDVAAPGHSLWQDAPNGEPELNTQQ